MAVEGFQGGSRGDTSAFMPYMRINLNVRSPGQACAGNHQAMKSKDWAYPLILI